MTPVKGQFYPQSGHDPLRTSAPEGRKIPRLCDVDLDFLNIIQNLDKLYVFFMTNQAYNLCLSGVIHIIASMLTLPHWLPLTS